MYPHIDVSHVPAYVLEQGEGLGSWVSIYNQHVTTGDSQKAEAALKKIEAIADTLRKKLDPEDREAVHYLGSVFGAVDNARSQHEGATTGMAPGPITIEAYHG